METTKIILDTLIAAVNEGKYDEHITIPFMSRDLIISSFKNKVQKRVDTSGNPMLSDADIKSCIRDAKEAAANVFFLYEKFGFIYKKEDGTFELTRKGKLAIRQSHLI